MPAAAATIQSPIRVRTKNSQHFPAAQCQKLMHTAAQLLPRLQRVLPRNDCAGATQYYPAYRRVTRRYGYAPCYAAYRRAGETQPLRSYCTAYSLTLRRLTAHAAHFMDIRDIALRRRVSTYLVF